MKAKWKNKSKEVSGHYVYYGSDRFYIYLDTVDRITGRNKAFTVYGDSPEWGNWKLVRE